jgi:DNA-binding SARP family transcriptional activator
VVGDAGAVVLGGPRQRGTLAILLLNANRVVSIDRLADDLYGGEPPVTAVTQVQRQVSELRKALADASLIETRTPGYLIRLRPEQLDLHRFERLTGEGGAALRRGDAAGAASLLREALALFRGAPLADLAYEGFAQPAVARLEELRLAALEQRIDADLALGLHGDLVAELEGLVREQPLHEGFRGRLMLSLYRAGRQAEALDVYRDARNQLVEVFGIEPSRELQELERSILKQEASLDRREGARAAHAVRPLLVVASDGARLGALVSVVEPLGRLPDREIILARLVADEGELDAAAEAVNAAKAELAVPARAAAFTSSEAAHDALRMATAYDVELVLLDAPTTAKTPLPRPVAGLLDESPADVAFFSGPAVELGAAGIAVPFAGGEHDWAALELAASLALAAGVPLTVVGTSADPAAGRRDASRLLADAALAVQRVSQVEAQSLLVEARESALAEAVAEMDLVVMGISPRWRQAGIGATRRALVRAARPSVLLVHAGPRPGALAPHGSGTRFTWSVAGG